MVLYPVTLTPDDNDTILVSFPDFPEAVTYGADREEALARAVDALETIIDAYIRDRQMIPDPSGIPADAVALPPLVAAKVQLHNEMRRQKVGKSLLARRMNVHLPQVDRLLNVHHGSTVEQLDAAARALGGRVRIEFVMPEPAASRLKPVIRSPHRSPRVHAEVLAAAKKRRESRRRLGGAKKK